MSYFNKISNKWKAFDEPFLPHTLGSVKQVKNLFMKKGTGGNSVVSSDGNVLTSNINSAGSYFYAHFGSYNINDTLKLPVKSLTEYMVTITVRVTGISGASTGFLYRIRELDSTGATLTTKDVTPTRITANQTWTKYELEFTTTDSTEYFAPTLYYNFENQDSAGAVIECRDLEIYTFEDQKQKMEIGGSNSQVQYNNNGVLGGSSGFTWANDTLSIPTLRVNQATAPTTTTDKLYNVAGSLYWNGTALGGGGGNVANGTAQGQMLFWNNGASEYQPTAVSDLAWDSTNKKISIGYVYNSKGMQIEGGSTVSSTLRFDSDEFRFFAGKTTGTGEVFSIQQNGEINIVSDSPSNGVLISQRASTGVGPTNATFCISNIANARTGLKIHSSTNTSSSSYLAEIDHNGTSLQGGLRINMANTTATAFNVESGVSVFAGNAGYYATTDMGGSDTDFASKKYVDDNVGISSRSYASCIRSTNQNTICTLANTYYEIIGNYNSNLVNGFSVVANRITYEGTQTKNFLLNGVSDIKANNNNTRVTYALYKNGVLVPHAETPTDIRHSTASTNIAITSIIPLAEDDYIEIFVKSSVAGVIITSETMQLTLVQV